MKLTPWLTPINPCERPPFSEEQLVVMALVDRDVPMTKKAIFDWIHSTLPYYSTLAREYMWESDGFYFEPPPPLLLPLHQPPLGPIPPPIPGHIPPPPPPPPLPGFYLTDDAAYSWDQRGRGFKHRFNSAVHHFDVPVREIELDKVDHWTVPLNEAQTFLQPLFAEEQEVTDRPFPFLRLPSELRMRIYEMLFALPQAGVRICKEPFGSVEITTVSKDLSDAEAQELWFDNCSLTKAKKPAYVITCRTPSQLLAPLLVCRLIHKEAMPVFFDINLFVFCGIQDMSNFLSRISPERRQYIRRIYLNLRLNSQSYYVDYSWDMKESLRQTRLLTACTGLRDVEIYSPSKSKEEEDWPFNENHIKVATSEVRRVIGAFAWLDHCCVRFATDRSTAFETELALQVEQMRLGRDMICS